MSWNYIDPFTTDKSKCFQCNSSLVEDRNDPAEITVYTREGVKFAQHYGKECPNKFCAIRFYCGYYTKCGEKVYNDLSDLGDYIITSDNTAFAIDYLYEVNLLILHGNNSFQALSDVYNQLHNFKISELVSRSTLNRQRLASGYFLYALLEMAERTCIEVKLNKKEGLENALLSSLGPLQQNFSDKWNSDHKCDVPNCETTMIRDQLLIT